MRFLSIDIFLNLAFPFQNEVSDLMYNWVAQGPDFKSALRVVKMVLNTQCYQYLTMQKIKRNTKKKQNRWFYYVNLTPELKNDEKLQKKNGSLNRNLLKFLNRYGIFWVPPGESSCPDGSEYVWQRGVESLQGQVTAARSWL